MMNGTIRILTGCLLTLLSCTVLVAQSGTFDPSFNGTGYVIDPVNDLDAARKILVQPDEKILLIGMSFDAMYVSRAHVARYHPDGSPDLGFGDFGTFTYENDFEANLYSAALTPEGKIVLVGSTTNYQDYKLLLIRLNADGTLDDSFGEFGVLVQSISVVSPNAEDMAYDVALDADGNILVCGSSYDENYIRRPIVARFTPDGQLDTDFGTDGVASIPAGVGSSAFEAIVVQPDGRILTSGSYGADLLWYELLLVRFEADGSLDSGFGDAGVVIHNHGNVDDKGYDLALTPDGAILVAGMTVSQTYNYSALLLKFASDGTLDMDFGDNGTIVEDLDDFDYAWEVELLTDGSIVMAGTSGDGPPNGFDMAVWKYHADGTPDAGFGSNGFAAPVIPERYAMIYGMAVQADGRILVGGQARTTENQNHFLVARLQNDLTNTVAERLTDHGTSAFPNPAVPGSTVTMNGPVVVEEDARLELIAADGRSVRTYTRQQFLNNGDDTMVQLPADIAPGPYHLTLMQQGTRMTTTIIVNP